MDTIKHVAHDVAIVAALAGLGASALMFAKGVADVALHVAIIAMG